MPTSADEVKNLSDDELYLVFALSHATEIRAVVDHGDDAIRSEVESWEPTDTCNARPGARQGRLNLGRDLISV